MVSAKEKVLQSISSADVKFVNLQFIDIYGTVKNVTIPSSQLEGSMKDGTWFDGSSIEGFARIHESDMYLMPDPETYSVLPWSTDKRTARIICDVYMPDKTPFTGDPRYILKKTMEEAEKMGFVFNTGPEPEFFLFKTEDGIPKPLPNDVAGYFDYAPMDIASDVRNDISLALQEMGMKVEASHHECAAGQHEIDFEYDNALRTADNVTTFKHAVKSIAQAHGLHATFMPKPIFGVAGSGMHVHQSLFDTKGNTAFFDPNDKFHLSEVAKHFIAGQLKHIREISAIVNPTINSYKRLVHGYEAPVYVCWAQKNRSALIRIPRYTEGKEKAVRAELRCPDPSANPYTAFALMLAAGLDGIKNKIEPPAPVEEDVYKYDDQKLKELKMSTLPIDLGHALELFKASHLCKETLGEHAFEYFITGKKAEWRDYRIRVTDWEIERYLKVL
ncbi:glutamine synthetase family protein [Candidatus Undinarchaeota archaeon]